MAIQGFDKEFYLNAKLAQLQSDSATAADWAGKDAAFLEARLLNGFGLTAEAHYEQYGYQEDLAPNAFFNPAEYIRAKATDMFNDPASTYLTIDEAAADFVAIWNGNVYNHYLQYGEEEGINPSNSFDVSGYYEAKLAQLQAEGNTEITTVEQVKEAFKAAGLTALEHFLTYGQPEEGLSAPAVPADEQVNVDTSVPGQVFTLTAGSDTGAAFTGTSGNDTFEAPVVQDGAGNLTDTLQNVDQLNGGEGTDTLNATLTANVGTVTPTLTGIEVVNVRAANTVEVDFSASTGVTNVNVKNSSAVATLTAVGGAAIGVANQNQNVDINGSTATALTLNLDTVGTKATDITVDLASGTTANAATSFAITAKDAHVTFAETQASAATTSATVAATGSNEITFATADLASIATLGVTGSGDVDFTGAAMTALKTLTAADGGVKVDATGGVLETATTGAGEDTITVVGANVKNISTGAGDDTVNSVTSAIPATGVVDLGAGDDTLSIAGAAFAKKATLTGGEGTDTLAMAKALYGTVSGYTAAELANVTGFEVLSITDAITTGDNIDVSSITGVTSFKAAAGVTTATSASVSNLGADSSVELAGAVADNGTLNVGLESDTSSDTVSLILNKDYTDNNDTNVGNTAASHTVVAAEVETLNVNSTANQTATFTPVDGYKADTVTNTLTLDGSNALTTLNISGDQKLVFASTAAMDKLATIDASSNTAGVTIDASLAAAASPALTIKGTAAADTISGGLTGDTITLGGGNDTLDFTKGASKIGTGKFDTITDFSANTYGNGTDGAAGTGAGASADWTGDVLKFTGDGGADGADVDVLGSAADATTYLANNAGSSAGIVAALDSSTGNLYVDNTDDGVADFFIQLTGVTTIDEAAFVVA